MGKIHMNKTTKRSEQAREMKNRILDVSVKLFGERGFEAVSICDIAAAAECSTGNIYHYFKNKEEIALMAITPVDEEYVANFEEDQDFLALPAARQLIVFGTKVVEIDSASPNMPNMYSLSLKNPELRALWVREDRAFYRIMTDILNRMMEEGCIREGLTIPLLREQVIAIIRGILVHWVINLHSFNITEEAQRAFEIFVRGIAE